jgi:hypothetical protein
VIGVIGIFVALGIAWWTNRRNQWAIHAIARFGGHGHPHPHPQQGQFQMHQSSGNGRDQRLGMGMGRKGLEAGDGGSWR